MSILIWDFDATLGERIGGWTGAILDALNASGIPHSESRDTIRPHLQSGYPWHRPEVIRSPKSYEQWWQDLADAVFIPYLSQVDGVGPNRAIEIAQTIDVHFLRKDSWRLLPGAMSTLKWAHRAGYTNVMLTNNAAGIQLVFEALGIAKEFSLIVNSADTGIEKPLPQAFNPIFEHYSICDVGYMIGDSIRADLAGATAIGIQTVLVGKSDPGAAFCIESVADLPAIIQPTRIDTT